MNTTNSTYEAAISTARSAANAAAVPEFDSFAGQVSARRATRLDEDSGARIRARRWLGLAALAFLLMPADGLLQGVMLGTKVAVEGIAVAVALPVAMLVWAARLVTRSSFRAQLLVRSIAVSNLIVALLLAVSVGGVLGVLGQSLIALSCFRALRLLGERGLDGQAGDATFTPVAFRGFLILALVMAFADAQTLMFSALTQASYWLTGAGSWELMGFVAPTLIAALIMALNVWGLLRLKTWAMLLNIVANLVIARMALTGGLSVNMYVAASLTLTAVVQLMLPVPILAAWIGDREAGGKGWRRGAGLLQACLPIMVVATPVFGVMNVGYTRAWGWLDGGYKAHVRVRGLAPLPDYYRVSSQLERGDRISGRGLPTLAYASELRPNLLFSGADFQACDLSNTDVSGSTFARGTYIATDFRNANLSQAVLVGADLRGAKLEGADLSGAIVAGCQLDGVRWTGATCPDGFVATAEEDCLGHLESERRIEAEELAADLGMGAFGCGLQRRPVEECSGLPISPRTQLRARGDDLELVWGPEQTHFVLEREGGSSWYSERYGLRVLAAPTPYGSVDMQLEDERGNYSRWIYTMSERDRRSAERSKQLRRLLP